MKTLITRLALATLCSLAAASTASAQASVDFFLRIDGIQGETQDSHATAQWRWSRALAGATFNPFEPGFTGGVSVAIGDLDGRWDSFGLSVFGVGPEEPPILRYELKEVLVTSYSISAASGGGLPWLGLSDFSSVTMQWRPLRADGSRGEAIVGRWDVASGRFDGDIAVLGAFDELGAERWADGTLVLTSSVPEPASWALWLLGAAVLAQRLGRVRG